MDNCIFCKIIRKEILSHIFWEDDKHVAFLSIFPNTLGFSVVTTKDHHGGHAFHQATHILTRLVEAAQKVTRLLEGAFDDVGRVAMIIEGTGVDHLHVKLVPLHGTEKDGKWLGETDAPDIYFEKYTGYISSHDGRRADDVELLEVVDKIRNVVKKSKN